MSNQTVSAYNRRNFISEGFYHEFCFHSPGSLEAHERGSPELKISSQFESQISRTRSVLIIILRHSLGFAYFAFAFHRIVANSETRIVFRNVFDATLISAFSTD
jgi:hypothetical protein